MFGVLRDVFGENKSLLEAAINLAQFPEDQEKENRDYEQPELDIHFSSLNPTSLANWTTTPLSPVSKMPIRCSN